MRGTLRPKEMVERVKMASSKTLVMVYRKDHRHVKLTDRSDNLTFEPKLVLEPSGEVRNTTLSILAYVWRCTNVVEHVS